MEECKGGGGREGVGGRKREEEGEEMRERRKGKGEGENGKEAFEYCTTMMITIT